jgi:hypothetical protein
MTRSIFTLAVVAACAISLANGFGFVARPTTTTMTSAAARCNPQPSHLYCHSFAHPLRHITQLTSLNNSNNLDNDTTTEQQQKNDENLTSIGSTEYYQGFLTRSPNEEPIERVTGDAILGPTLKFAGGISLILVVLVLVFLGSNGLL